MRRTGIPCVAVLLVTAALAGCNVLPAQAPPPQSHDFGPLPAVDGDAGAQPRVDRVSAPSWMDDGAIHYRLVYQDPTLLRSYAMHRWAAPPSEMFRQKLAYLLDSANKPAGPAQPALLLDVELLEFEQDFSSPQQAEVKLVATVSLRQALGGKTVAQKQFVLATPGTPDVQGAVAGLSRLAGEAAAQIAAWCGNTMDDSHPAPGD